MPTLYLSRLNVRYKIYSEKFSCGTQTRVNFTNDLASGQSVSCQRHNTYRVGILTLANWPSRSDTNNLPRSTFCACSKSVLELVLFKDSLIYTRCTWSDHTFFTITFSRSSSPSLLCSSYSSSLHSQAPSACLRSRPLEPGTLFGWNGKNEMHLHLHISTRKTHLLHIGTQMMQRIAHQNTEHTFAAHQHKIKHTFIGTLLRKVFYFVATVTSKWRTYCLGSVFQGWSGRQQVLDQEFFAFSSFEERVFQQLRSGRPVQHDAVSVSDLTFISAWRIFHIDTTDTLCGWVSDWKMHCGCKSISNRGNLPALSLVTLCTAYTCWGTLYTLVEVLWNTLVEVLKTVGQKPS